MARKGTQPAWLEKIGHPTQIGGIETSVLDDGPGRGTRIAWINTGSGLRCKVVIDRALDVVDAFYNQHSLVWLSHGGITAPRPDASQGLDWLECFPGGLLTTCGLTHVGGPETDDSGSRGLHGRISNCPARLTSIVQPDPAAGRMEMSISAVMTQSRVFGPHLELHRTLSATLGQSVLRVHDRVINCANTTTPHMLLYHCNFGWPLVDKGTRIVWKGNCRSRGLDMDNVIFNDKRDFKTCCAPRQSHTGGGEACGFIDVTADRQGRCSVGLHNPKHNLALALHYQKKQLPCLANWQHWGPGEYVTGLEPGTNFPIGRNQAKKDGTLQHLGPGKSKTYEMAFEILTDPKQIKAFVRKSGE